MDFESPFGYALSRPSVTRHEAEEFNTWYRNYFPTQDIRHVWLAWRWAKA